MFQHSIRRRINRRTIAIAAALIVASALLSVPGANLITSSSAKADSATVVTVDPTKIGDMLPATTQGISLEASALTQSTLVSGNFATYLQTLGPGVLRVGGNSADRLFWTSTGEVKPSWATGTLTPADLQRLSAVSNASGWPVTLAVNLEHYDPIRAADEAASAQQILGYSLQSIEIGNEPDEYYSDTTKFWTDFEAYVAAIHQKVPDVEIYGPSTTGVHPSFDKAFLQHEAAAPAPDVTAFTTHHYAGTVCSGQTFSTSQMLSSNTYNWEKTTINSFVSAAQPLRLRTLIDETNSASCGGASGVSNTYASALWSFGYELAAAQAGVTGIDFHSTDGQCGPGGSGNPMSYSPFCATSSTAANAGTLTAQPEYYGLLALRQMQTGEFVNVDNPNWPTVHAYAIKDGNIIRVALINVQDPATTSAGPVTVNIKGGAYSSASVMRLSTSSADGLKATSGVTLGEQSVSADGTFATPNSQTVAVSESTLPLTLPAGSAAIVIFGTNS